MPAITMDSKVNTCSFQRQKAGKEAHYFFGYSSVTKDTTAVGMTLSDIVVVLANCFVLSQYIAARLNSSESTQKC
jgi:hypothetical protein